MVFSRFSSALLLLALLVATMVLQPTVVYAQVNAGGGAAGYHIFSADGQARYLGFVLVVAKTAKILPDSIMLPKEFQPGAEYWYWQDKSMAYTEAFFLAPSDSLKLPSDNVRDYNVFGHLAFDLAAPQPFPKMSQELEWTYTVYTSDSQGKPLDKTPEAWFAFSKQGNGSQLAWARKDLGNAYLTIQKDQSLLFVRSPLPAAGSVEVVVAR